MPDLHRIALVRDRRPHQRLFDRSPLAARGSRTNVPGCRRHDLVVLDLAALELDPVAEGPTRRLGGAPALAVLFLWLDVEGLVERELAQATLDLPIDALELVHARKVAQEHARPAHLSVHVEDQAVLVLPGRHVIAARDQLASERP